MLRKIFIVCMLALATTNTSMAQVKNKINSLWQKINTAASNNKPKDALLLAEQIQALSQKNNIGDEYIKATCYKFQLERNYDEDAWEKNIGKIKDELQKSKGIEKNIWHSYLANALLSHYQQNRYELHERATSNEASTKDISTWAAQDYFDTIGYHIEQSLANKAALKKISIAQYPAIISNVTNCPELNHTLYEVLMHSAIAYYKSDEIEIAKPKNILNLNAANGLIPEEAFATYNYSDKTFTSSKIKAMQLLQELYNHYKTTRLQEGMVYCNLERLIFAKSNSNERNTAHYEQEVMKAYSKHPQSKLVQNALLNLCSEKFDANSISLERKKTLTPKEIAEKTSNRIAAVELVSKIKNNSAHSKVQKAAAAMALQFGSCSIQLQTQDYHIPNQPILANITYSNCKEVEVKIARLPTLSNEASTIVFSKIKGKKYTTQHSNDYQQHSADIVIEPQAAGRYIIEVSNKQTKSTCNTFILVSNIAVVSAQAYGGKEQVYFVNRTTGEPLRNIAVMEYATEYNKGKTNVVKQAQGKTNEQGEYNIQTLQNGIQLYTRIDKDTFFEHETRYNNGNTQYEAETVIPQMQLFFYTDRALYRPGQTIFVKGIMVHKDHATAVTNEEVLIELLDVNDNILTAKKVKLNAYNSFADSFVVPQNIALGQFTIKSEHGSHSVTIEEYKRPKFEIITDTIANAYSLGDNVEMKGIVKAYAGFGMSKVQLKYRVVRTTQRLYRWCMPSFSSNTLILEEGEMTTDDNGQYLIKFDAIADTSYANDSHLAYEFTLYIDATDINGETHNATQSITLSDTKIKLSTLAIENINSSETLALKYEISNFNNLPANAPCQIVVEELVPCTKNFVEKKWTAPDEFWLTQKEWEAAMPNQEYNNEGDYKLWQVKNKIIDTTLAAASKGTLAVKQLPASNTYLRITFTATDSTGKTIVDKQYTRLINTNAPALIAAEKKLEIKDDQAGNSDYNVKIILPHYIKWLLTLSTKNKTATNFAWISLDKNSDAITQLLMQNKTLGNATFLCGIANNEFCEAENKYSTASKARDVLKINITTFRDNIEPNSKQKWQIQITDEHNKVAQAEVLSSMYDASLDAIASSDWGMPVLQEEEEATPNCYFECSNRSKESSNDYYTPGPDIENAVLFELENYIERFVALQKRKGSRSLLMQDGYSYLWQTAEEKDEEEKKAYEIKLGKLIMQRSGGGKVRAAAPMLVDASPAKSTLATHELKGYFAANANYKVATDDANGCTAAAKPPPAPPRTNFKETAFWMPQLHTDEKGNCTINFEAPEALTRWRWRILAHTKQGKAAYESKEITTSKKLMVVTNNTRFFRIGDKSTYSVKVHNSSNATLKGHVTLSIADALTGEDLNSTFANSATTQAIQLEAGASQEVAFNMSIHSIASMGIAIKAIATAQDAKGNNYSDGEQNIIPLLSNDIAVQEHLNFVLRGSTEKNLQLPTLINSAQQQQHNSMQIDYCTTPAWYAVQALPYLAYYPHQCAEQTFNRYYATTLSYAILNSNPSLAQALITQPSETPLQAQNKFSNTALNNTPWQKNAREEQSTWQQLLRDRNASDSICKAAFGQLVDMQRSDGSFAWFSGMEGNRYITQYILTGLGKMKTIASLQNATANEQQLASLTQRGVQYCDNLFLYWYKQQQSSKNKMSVYHNELQYLYMRSHYLAAYPPSKEVKKAIDDCIAQLNKEVLQKDLYNMALGGIVLHRFANIEKAKSVATTLVQLATTDAEKGMRWLQNKDGYYWYNNSIATHTTIMQCLQEIAPNSSQQADMQLWLLLQKRTSHWPSTVSTAEACHTLLSNPSVLSAAAPKVAFTLGNQSMVLLDKQQNSDHHFLRSIQIAPREIKPSMGNIKVSSQATAQQTIWGGVHYNYTAPLASVQAQSSEIVVSKKMYTVENSATGEQLIEVQNGKIKIGSRVRIRIQITVPQRMEFLHLNDMRAACFEPVRQLSGYEYSGGLGYYYSAQDASTHFFVEQAAQGKYLLEYDVFATNRGVFDGGIASLECMYAPAFGAHTSSEKVEVK